MTAAPQPKATWRHQPQWLYLYLLLAVFVVGGLAISGWLTHRLILGHRRSVEVNMEWVKHLMTSDELARQASAVVQPVNGALQSRDPTVEAAQFRAAIELFTSTLDVQIDELQAQHDGEEREMLTRDCREVVAQMDAAAAVANQVFEAIRTGEKVRATERLAVLNREYDDVLAALNQLRAHYRQRRQAFLEVQLADAARLGRWEYGMVGLALMTLISFVLYGVRLSLQIGAIEVQLRASEIRYRTLFESSADAVMTVQPPTWKFTSVNPATMAMFGTRGAEHLLSLGPWELSPEQQPDGRASGEKAKEMIETAMRDGSNSFEWMHRRINGELFPATVLVSRIEIGGNVFLQATVRDITEQKQAEKLVRASEAKYRALIETTKTGYLILDAEGKVVDANPEYVRLTGRRDFREIHGRSVTEWTAEYEKKKNAMAVAQCARDGFIRDLSIDYIDSTGRITPVEINATAVSDIEGIRIISLCRDITRRRQDEDIVRVKNTELERFTYAVSHDLRSPLVTIQTFCGQLEQDIPTQNAVRVAADLNFIQTAANKMALLLDELLKLSRLGRQTNPPADVLLQTVMKEVLDLVAGRISQRGARVMVAEGPVMLRGDRAHFVALFQNLVDNACKFMGNQPAPRIEIRVETRAAETVFLVRDNGIGIDPRHQSKVFGLFEKLDPKADGTGIGLALVKRIVELYGGWIRVESNGAGRGACFYFTLPGAAREDSEQ